MSRFYAGQPVACVKGLDFWLPGATPVAPGLVVPRLGQRYVVGGYRSDRADYLNLVGLNRGHWYREDGFAPITDEQVRGIIEEAIRPPVMNREMEST